MPSPTEVSNAIMDGLNEHYGYLDSEIRTSDDGALVVVLNYEDGTCYMVRIDEKEATGYMHRARKIERRAYREGWIACYIERALSEDNPYVESTTAHDCWSKGYSAAHAEFCRENV